MSKISKKSNNNILKFGNTNPFSHECFVTYDTLVLNAKLTAEEIYQMFQFIYFEDFRFDNDGNYKYIFSDKNAGFFINLIPLKTEKSVYFNIKITIHRSFYHADNIENYLKILDLHSEKWCVKNLHVAFDFIDKRDKSVVIKHHLNVQHIQKLEEIKGFITDYVGPYKTHNVAGSVLLAHYNRNNREIARNNQSDYHFDERLEFRMTFKTDEILAKEFFNNDDSIHELIKTRLQPFLFVPNIDNLQQCTPYLKRSFRVIQSDYSKINNYKDKYNQIRSIAQLNRFPFELAYENNRYSLLQLFNTIDSITDNNVAQLYYCNLA